MRTSRFKIAKPDITKFFDKYPSKILTRSNIEQILSENKSFWRLGKSITVNKFVQLMIDEAKLKEIKFEFPNRKILRYTWEEVSTYELVLSLLTNSYFSHYTAVYLHELTEQVPKTIYLNFEQPLKKRRPSDLEQDKINMAFQNKQRVSQNIATYFDQKICILNGMYTGRLGVIEIEGSKGERIYTTNIERTLIDITVRPEYAGGVFEVLKAYKLAKNKVSINKLAAMLKKISYTYPYHQAIGFYLERAGVYEESQIKLLTNFDMKYDFYLTHQMKEIDYSKRWRLFFPKGF
jgi:predicted transcriptional regulator of viral defense system